ncbi:MAG: hypothetical protein M1339_01930, partial [Bacteroidetes bacterium]|nr:hypothetical protein [Bacteroidota bacterium]
LKQFVEAGILRLGGSILPRGEFFQIITPKPLLRFPNVLSKYELATFDRKAAMRKRSSELLGVGHPLVDAIVSHFQEMTVPGDAASLIKLPTQGEPFFVVNTLVTVELEGGKQHREFRMIRISPSGDAHVLPDEWLISRLVRRAIEPPKETLPSRFDIEKIRQAYEGAIGAILSQVKSSLEKPVTARVRLLGISTVS